MPIFNKATNRFVLLLLVTSLTSCGDSDAYVSFGGKSFGQPVFCISAKANCAAPGSSLSNLTVDEVDASGKDVVVAWEVHASNGAFKSQRAITYGQAPAGWDVKTPPRQLVPGHHYNVNRQYYFGVTPNGLLITERKP